METKNNSTNYLSFEASKFLNELNYRKADYSIGYATKSFDVSRKVGERFKVVYTEIGELVDAEECNRYSSFKSNTIAAVTPKEAYVWFNNEGFLNMRIKETWDANGAQKYFVQVIVQKGAIIIMESDVKDSGEEAVASLFEKPEFKAIASKRVPH